MATTYYVSTSGNNSNPGTIGSPFLTVNKGVSVLTPGDTLLIRAGTYVETLDDVVPGGTSWGVPVTVSAFSGETVILQPAAGATNVLFFASSTHIYIQFLNIILDAVNVSEDCVKITWSSGGGTSHHIRLQGCEIKNAPAGQGVLIASAVASGHNCDFNEILNCSVHGNGGTNVLNHGFYITSSNNLVEGCDVFSNSNYGIQIYHADTHSTGWCSNNIVRNNLVHGNNAGTAGTGAGIVVASGDSNLVYNNVVYGNAGGIQVNYGANATGVYNNTFYNNGGNPSLGYGVRVGGTGPATNTVVQNNLFYQNTLGGLSDGGTGTVADHNSNNSTNPLFVNAGGADFHITTGSPVIDAGRDLSSVFTTDLDGVTRPQGTAFDQGAYEFITSVQIASASLSSVNNLKPTGSLSGVGVASFGLATALYGMWSVTIGASAFLLGVSDGSAQGNTGKFASSILSSMTICSPAQSLLLGGLSSFSLVTGGFPAVAQVDSAGLASLMSVLVSSMISSGPMTGSASFSSSFVVITNIPLLVGLGLPTDNVYYYSTGLLRPLTEHFGDHGYPSP